jgi:hypothetical protein
MRKIYPDEFQNWIGKYGGMLSNLSLPCADICADTVGLSAAAHLIERVLRLN